MGEEVGWAIWRLRPDQPQRAQRPQTVCRPARASHLTRIRKRRATSGRLGLGLGGLGFWDVLDNDVTNPVHPPIPGLPHLWGYRFAVGVYSPHTARKVLQISPSVA